jgi:hypothetical protein
MKPRHLSRLLGIGSVTCAVALALHTQVAQATGSWDPGVPSRLFKDGQTRDKKPKPTHRLTPAPEKCPDCQALVDQLQAALDDWYAMQYAEGDKNRKEAGFGDDAASNEKREKAMAQMADAMAGLGQPADGSKAAQNKQKENAKNPKLKESRASKEALAKEIQRLLDLLQKCLDKCGEEEKKPVAPKPDGGSSPTGGGGVKEPPNDGAQPGGGGGEKPKEGGVQPLPKLPVLPECWKGDAKKKFMADLEDAEQKFLKLRGYYGGHGGFTGDNDVREAEGKKVNDALKKINDLKEEAENKIKDCPHGMAPQRPEKIPTENVGLPGVGGETCARLISEGRIKIDSEGTGETIGHIADLVIENLTDEPIVSVIPPMVLESISGKNQNYGCLEAQTVRIDPYGKATVPMKGVCIARNKPPVGKGVTGDLLINEGNPAIAQNPSSRISTKDAGDLLRICSSKYKAAEKLQQDGAFKDFPYRDKQKQLDIVMQWLVWSDPRISEMTGAPPAKKEDFKKVIYKQVEEHGPLTPETKKKIDKGADTMWDGIELASAKAKDLEPEETPAGGPTIEEGLVGQPEYVGQTRAKMPTPTPKPKPGGGKPQAPPKDGGKTEEKPPPPKKPDTPAPAPPAAPDYPTKDQVTTFEKKQEEEIKKARAELEKAGTDAEKQKRAKAKLNALEKICYEARWAGGHTKDDKNNAASSYDDANAVLGRLDGVPDARKRLKDAGLSDQAIKDALDNLNGAADPELGTPTGMPMEGGKSGGAYQNQATQTMEKAGLGKRRSQGGEKLGPLDLDDAATNKLWNQIAKDLKDLYMAEGVYRNDEKK